MKKLNFLKIKETLCFNSVYKGLIIITFFTFTLFDLNYCFEKDVEKLYQEALQDVFNEDYADAFTKLKELHNLSPRNTKIMFAIGYVLGEMNKTDEALSWMKKCIEIEPNYIPVWYYFRIFAKRCSNPEDAYNEFITLAKKNKKQFAARLNLGIIYKEKGEDEKALNEFKKHLS